MDPKENDSVKNKMSHSKVFCKKEIVKYFVKHTGKINLPESLFYRAAGIQPAIYQEKDSSTDDLFENSKKN